MTNKPLAGVVALVTFRADSTFNFKHSISTKLTDLGARVTKRYGKDVTHIVFQKRLQPNTEQLLAERADLRALHDKALKAEAPVHVVSLLWVERSASDNMRAMEQKYAIARPSDDDLLGHKSSGLTPGSSGRKRSRKTMQPKDLKELEVDTTDAMYSSSQLIREQSKAEIDLGEVSSPAPPHKKPRTAQQVVTRFVRYDGNQKARKPKAQGPQGQQAVDVDAALHHAARPAKGSNTITAALSRQKQRQGRFPVRQTQDRPGTANKRKRDNASVETEIPQQSGSKSVEVAVQRQQPAMQKAATAQTANDTGQPDSNGKVRPGSADAVKSATRRQSSRLCKATGHSADVTDPAEAVNSPKHSKGPLQPEFCQPSEPDLQQMAHISLACSDEDMLDAPLPAFASASSQQASEAATLRQGSNVDISAQQQGIHANSPAQQQSNEPLGPTVQGAELKVASLQRCDAGASATGVQHQQSSLATQAPVLIPGGSSRFSTRHLKQQVEVKLPVSKATPLGLPPTPLLAHVQQPSTIPIPDFTRVPSPWTTTPLVATQPTPPLGALLAAPATQPALPAAVSSQPACADTATAAPQVWSAVRPWDLNPTTNATGPAGQTAEALAVPVSASAVSASAVSASAVSASAVSTSQEHVGPTSEVGVFTVQAPDPHTERQATHGQAQTVGLDQQAANDEDMHEADELPDNSSPSAAPPTGCLSLSCVEAATHEVARNAVRSLRGMRLCSEGHEEGRLTHLVLGQSRRTLKVLLAIAAGAILVTPDWLTASLEAGEWLPEEPFLAQGRFADAAQAARGGSDHSKPEPLLHGRKVYVHVAEAARKGASSGNGSALRRLVTALGGKAAGAKNCDLCIISGGGPRPARLGARILAVKEEWLLKGTEQYRLESTRLYAVK